MRAKKKSSTIKAPPLEIEFVPKEPIFQPSVLPVATYTVLENVKDKSLEIYSGWSQEVQDAIVLEVSKGVRLSVAATLHGLSPKLVASWMKKGEEESFKEVPDLSTPYFNFYCAIKSAQAQCEAQATKTVTQAFDWKAATWYLTHGPARKHWRPANNVSAQVRVSLNAADPRLIARQKSAEWKPSRRILETTKIQEFLTENPD